MRFLFVATVLALAGCGQGAPPERAQPMGGKGHQIVDVTPTPPPAPKYDATDAWIDGRANLVALLRDPDSAQFTDGFVSESSLEDGGKIMVACGRVNSKNGFGGYTGAVRWLGNGGMAATEQIMAADEFSDVWLRFCTNKVREMPDHKGR